MRVVERVEISRTGRTSGTYSSSTEYWSSPLVSSRPSTSLSVGSEATSNTTVKL